jgi:plastocyanin
MRRAVALAVAALAITAPPAAAVQRTETYRYGPIHIEPYGMDERDYVSGVPGPQVDGYMTGGTARLVDAQGRPVSQARVMLHHLVFSNAGARLGERTNPTCDRVQLFDDLSEVPGLSEPVAGFAEEHVDERLPAGYGYPIRAGDRWVATWMLMNHRDRPEDVWIEYQSDVVTGEALKPAYPVWLDVGGCGLDPIFDVRGGGRRGSTSSRSTTVPAPFTGRIVAALGHLHGGGRSTVLTQPACGGRELLRSTPTWGGPRSLPYRIRPVLHEPSPLAMSTVRSEQGFAVHAGEPLTLTATYDAERPHTRVMGIMGLYIAPDASVRAGCARLPTDVQVAVMRGRGTRRGFRVRVARPPGRTVLLDSAHPVIDVSAFAFAPANVAVRQGSVVRWRFWDDALHNVTLADGPAGFSSPNLSGGRVYEQRLTRPGVYRLTCSLHAATMTSTVTVLPRRR